MAVIHGDASLSPGKVELLGGWLPSQAWAPAGPVDIVASYRLDDPAGRVGIECFVLAVGDATVHLPVTYRDAPLGGGMPIGEMEHSRLGHRWAYDAATDPVAVATLIATMLSGGTQAALEVHHGEEKVDERPPVATVRGSGRGSADRSGSVVPVEAVAPISLGAVASVVAGGFHLDVLRIIGAAEIAGEETLVASWPGFEGVVAAVRFTG